MTSSATTRATRCRSGWYRMGNGGKSMYRVEELRCGCGCGHKDVAQDLVDGLCILYLNLGHKPAVLRGIACAELEQDRIGRVVHVTAPNVDAAMHEADRVKQFVSVTRDGACVRLEVR